MTSPQLKSTEFYFVPSDHKICQKYSASSTPASVRNSTSSDPRLPAPSSNAVVNRLAPRDAGQIGDDALHVFAAMFGENIFQGLMEAAKYCSLGQISGALYAVGGQYRRNM